MKTYEYFQNNINDVKSLIKVGAISPTYLSYFEIFTTFNSCKELRSKRKRHFFTSDVLNISYSTVQRAIRIMESDFR